MKDARALTIAAFVVICTILLLAQSTWAQGRGGGSFGGGGFHGGSIGNNVPVTGGYGYPYGYGGYSLNYGGVTNPTPETSNPLGSSGDQTYQVYGPREPAPPGAATNPPARVEPRGTVAPEDVLDQGGPGDPLRGHLNDDWWEVGGSSSAAKTAVGATVASLPIGYETGTVGSRQFYYREGVFYASAASGSGYEVIAPPIGAAVTTIPGSAELETVDNQKYFNLDGSYYQPFYAARGLVYKVVENPHH